MKSHLYTRISKQQENFYLMPIDYIKCMSLRTNFCQNYYEKDNI